MKHNKVESFRKTKRKSWKKNDGEEESDEEWEEMIW